jgi:2-polyprenyl-6-hydroxyphenyl methylase/3-demethylubiquinone-9 3-methyltransferase
MDQQSRAQGQPLGDFPLLGLLLTRRKAGMDRRAVIRALVSWQMNLSRKFDGLLPDSYRIDGNRFFIDTLFPRFLAIDNCIWDVGGGKQPIVSKEVKSRYRLNVTGLDISESELKAAPADLYDHIVCADVTSYRGKEHADLVVCQALLEHVLSTEKAVLSIASMLRPGGLALIFVPSRNAVFARLNLLLPERVKRALLFTIFPKTRQAQGYRSYYDRCTPRDFEQMAGDAGFEVVEAYYFYKSSYFSFFFPLYLLWRLWVLVFKTLRGKQAAETFIYVFRKREASPPDR